MKKQVFFKTFGCRTNVFDTQVMVANLKNFEVTTDESNSDTIVINSCTVTNSADTNVRHYVNSIKKKYPKKKIVLTGCGVLTKGEELFKSERVSAVFGSSQKEQIDDLLQRDHTFFEVGDLHHIDETIVEDFVGKSRAFVKIQEGCSFRCSYCIIPYVRGDSRSYSEGNIVEQIALLAQNGYGEFILTGTNIGSYGDGNKRSLARLLKLISQVKGVRRIRLGSVEPIQITDEFLELLDEPWMAKHLHIALQHTNNDMLKIMNRRNRLDKDLKLFETIASHGYALGTDFIVGHPGEDELKWKDAMENMRKFPLTHIHAFTYSKRDGTPSATMKETVNGNVAKARYNELTALIDEKNRLFRQSITTPLDVLVETYKDGYYQGFDQYFNHLYITSPHDISGDWINVENFSVKEKENYAIIS
jgi:MiaB-like tRNA modifying enzyme